VVDEIEALHLGLTTLENLQQNRPTQKEKHLEKKETKCLDEEEELLDEISPRNLIGSSSGIHSNSSTPVDKRLFYEDRHHHHHITALQSALQAPPLWILTLNLTLTLTLTLTLIALQARHRSLLWT